MEARDPTKMDLTGAIARQKHPEIATAATDAGRTTTRNTVAIVRVRERGQTGTGTLIVGEMQTRLGSRAAIRLARTAENGSGIGAISRETVR